MPCANLVQRAVWAIGADLAAVKGVAVDPTGKVLVADGPSEFCRSPPTGRSPSCDHQSAERRPVDHQHCGRHGLCGHPHARPDRRDHRRGHIVIAGHTTPVVETGISGYHGNSDPNFGNLSPGSSCRSINPPGCRWTWQATSCSPTTVTTWSRAHVPSTSHVIDDLDGVVTGGGPQGGYTPDGSPANHTLLQLPQAVAASAVGPVIVVADTGNASVRQFGRPSTSSPFPRSAG